MPTLRSMLAELHQQTPASNMMALSFMTCNGTHLVSERPKNSVAMLDLTCQLYQAISFLLASPVRRLLFGASLNRVVHLVVALEVPCSPGQDVDMDVWD